MSSTKEDWLESLSTSNRPPSLQEASAAGKLLLHFDQKLKFVDRRIAALEHELNGLKTQQSIIREEKHRYADILSARRRLPPEIIARFMELACMGAKESSASRSPHHQVQSFMLVSREWYRTACGTPHFWTDLDMDLTKSSVEETRNSITKAVALWDRAAGLRLSLNIGFSTGAPNTSQIVDFIHSIPSRLGVLTLHLQVNSMPELHILDSLFRHTSSRPLVWPALHTLRIQIQSDYPGNEITAGSSLLISSAAFPLLRNCAITSFNVIFISYQIPWSNLQRLDLGPLRDLELRQYLLILGECTSLHFLRLRLQYRINNNPISNLGEMTLPHLTHFEFESTDIQVYPLARLLGHLKLPSLLSCTFTALGKGGQAPIILRLTELFHPSGCSESIEYLELNLMDGLARNLRELGHLFKQVPYLTVLKLSGSKMDKLTLRDVPCSVCDLSVDLCDDNTGEGRTAFVDYLRFRLASSDVPLKARLHVDTVPTITIRERLDTLKHDVGGRLDVVMD